MALPARPRSESIPTASAVPAVPSSERLTVEVFVSPGERSTLLRDVEAGFATRPYRLPPKHFYDDQGSQLFDRICDTPEYYLTRAETALLERVALDVIATSGASDLVELGSGAARKTAILLDALTRVRKSPRYVPVEINEGMVRRSARALLARYPSLSVHGIVGDYERHLARAPHGGRKLVAFLGSTIGNFEPDAAVSFLKSLATQLSPGDHLLMGVDLVKDPAVIERAYNDAQGLTAAFNRNVLRVVNATLGADFDPMRFEHVAFFNPERSQIEMHLRAVEDHAVRIEAIDRTVPFTAGETIHTEISRKFTQGTAEALLTAAGFRPVRWDTDPDGTFGLALGRREP